MNSLVFYRMFLVAFGGLLAASSVTAAEEDEAADLNSYSVGDRRPVIEQQKIVIERPSFDSSFKMEMPKPDMSNIQIAKPKLEILTGRSPDSEEPTRTASTSGAAAGAGATTGNETRPVRPVRMDAPQYPRDALRRGEEGHVIVEFTINAQGTTEDITIVEAEPRGSFDNEARRAVSRWTFEPALQDGRPIAQRIRHTLEFNLNDQ